MAVTDVVWSPTEEFKESLNVTQLMREVGVDGFAALHAWSVAEPEAFWRTTIERLNIQFRTPYSELLNLDDGVSKARWLVGAEMNIADSCFFGPSDRIAIITQRYDKRWERISFEHLESVSNRVAYSLSAIGVVKGDAVAIDMAMTAEAVAIYLGCVKAGVAVVSIPDSFPEEEIAKRLRIGKAKAVFTQDVMPRGDKLLPMYEKVYAAAEDIPIIVWPALGEMHVTLHKGDMRWEEEFLSAFEAPNSVACAPDDLMNVIFSSGTTGDPKAIPWTHSTPIKCGADAHWHHNIIAQDVVCWPTSLGWMMGPWLIFASFLNGATMALYEGGPVERGFCEFMVDAKVSMMGLVPSIAKGWRASGCADGLDFSGITRYSSSGEASNALDYAWLMGLNQADGNTVPVVEYCGGTEIAGGYLSNHLTRPNRPAQFNGKALGIDFVLLDDAQQPCAIGEAGELFIVPPSIGLSTHILNRDNEDEYYKGCPRVDGKTLRRHGDRVIALKDGYFCSDGRADNAMNLGGIKTGSAEIERVVSTVDGVVETAAIGVVPSGGGPDQLVIFAVLAGAPNLADIKDAMQRQIKTKLNPLFKLHEVVAVDKLPRTASNKVMHRELKARYKQGLEAV